MAANPITFTEIAAWDSLMQRGVTEFEVACIVALDRVRLKWAAKRAESKNG